MKKLSVIFLAAFTVALAVITLQGCKSKKKLPPFFPVNNYISQQITQVDSGATFIYKITANNGHRDSVPINKQQFNQLAKSFLQYDINSSAIHNNYKESTFFDATTNSLTFNYSADDSTLPLQSVDVLMDTAASQIKWVFLSKVEGGAANPVFVKAGWKNGEHFFINKSGGADGLITQQTIIVWRNAP